MVIYIKSDGTTQVVSPEHIYQGSSVNTITLITPFPSTVAMQVGFRLPDGSVEQYKPMQYVDTVINGVTVSAYTYQLTAAITSQIGTVGIAFCALFSNGKQTSYLANIEVEKSILPELPPAPSEDVYNLILKYLQENSADIEEMQREIIVISTKTNSAYNIASHARVTANEAKEIAEEALDQSKVTGTQVQVRGVFQKTLDFISDPQSQINAKTQVNVDGVGQGLISFTSDPQAQINNLNIEINRVDNSAQQGIAQVDVKAEQGITTANEAKEIAREALDQSKVTGTQVKVGGVFQPSLDFTSDPQAQLNGKYSEINPQPPYQAVELRIPDGANLNDYVTPGVYISPLSEHKIINLPNTGNGAGKLVVYTSAEGGNYITQEWIQVASTNRWVRSSNGDYNPRIWSAWRKVLYEDVAYIAPNELKNLNDAPKNAYVKMSYSTGSDVQNRPTTSGGFWLSAFSSADYGEQIYASDNGNVYFRPFSGGVWENWKTALLIAPTQLEVSTANGWTIGGTLLVAPSPQGVYLVSVSSPIANGVYLAPVGFTIVNNRSFSSLVQRTVSDGGDLFLLTCVYINGNSSWTLRHIPSDATVTITRVAYKKII